MLKKMLLLTLTAAFIAALSGCNTIHGFGQDMEVVGESLQEASAQ